jgi:hypothetical protein
MSTTTVVEGRFGKGSGNDSFSRSLYLLVRYYAELLDIVDAFCFGFTVEAGKDRVKVLILDADLNVDYLRLCHQIDGLLKQAGFEEIRKAHWRPFANLLTLEDEADAWVDKDRKAYKDLYSAIRELHIRDEEQVFDLAEEQDLLDEIDEDLEQYRQRFRDMNDSALAKASKNRDERERAEWPELSFECIDDERLRHLMTSDWEEVRAAYRDDLYKSAAILAGGIVEALLRESLVKKGDDAIEAYRRKYHEAPLPDMLRWQLHQVIGTAAELGIISGDVANFSHVIRAYRNLVHLHAQYRERSVPTRDTVSIILRLVVMVHSQVGEWHKKRRGLSG